MRKLLTAEEWMSAMMRLYSVLVVEVLDGVVSRATFRAQWGGDSTDSVEVVPKAEDKPDFNCGRVVRKWRGRLFSSGVTDVGGCVRTQFGAADAMT